MTALLVGFGAGFMVSMQLGPLSLFLIRSTLRGTLAIGLAIGAGIAIVDALYAAAGAAGAAPVLSIDSVRTVLGLVGAAVLIALGARTLWSAFRVRLGGDEEAEPEADDEGVHGAIVSAGEYGGKSGGAGIRTRIHGFGDRAHSH